MKISTGVKYPRNASPVTTGTIHDDQVAANLGFRGGAVAGSIHLDQFGPALVEAFGPAWFETGSLGLYFTHPLTDQEPVEGLLDIGSATPPVREARVAIDMVTPEGTSVAVGTATVGDVSSPSPVTSRDRRSVEPNSLRLLASATIGMALPAVVVSPSQGDQRERVTSGLMTAPLSWYVEDSPWGGPICSPLTISRMMTGDVMKPFGRIAGDVIPLYGALEFRHLAGPLFLDEDYLVAGVLTDVSETPKTEIFWCDMTLRRASDPSGPVLATMTAMTRLLKMSSPLYHEPDA